MKSIILLLLSLCLIGNIFSQPINNTCASATVLVEYPSSSCIYATGTTVGATMTSEMIISPESGDTVLFPFPAVWCTFTPDSTMSYILEVNSGADTTNWDVLTGDCNKPLEVFLFSGPSITFQKDSVYLFAIYTDSKTDFDICIYKVVPPPNDSCVNAIVLTESARDNCSYISGTTIGATTTLEVFNAQGYIYSENNEIVWYTFTPDSSGSYTIEIDEEESTTAYWQVSTGNCSDTLVVIKNPSLITGPVDLLKDSAYFFSIYSIAPTDFDICLYYLPPPPPNDSCTTAIELIAGDIGQCNAISGTTQGATFSIYNVRSLDGSINQSFFPAVWYEFTPDSTANYTLDVLADLPNATSNLNKVNFWQILTGSCQDTLNEVAQLIPNIGINTIRFEKNTTYYFSGYFVDLGQFDILEIEFDICISQTASHENDACTTSLPLSTGCTTGTTVNASSNLDEIIFDQDGDLMTSGFPLVWYKLSPDATGVYSFSMSNNSRGYNGMLLLTGSCNDTLLTKSSFINIGVDSLVKDSTYFLAVSIADTVDFIGYTEFEFELCIEFCSPPTNDLWSDAISLQESDTESCQNAEAGTTLCATTPQRFGYPGVWYEFTPDSTKMYSLSVYGTSAAVIGYMSILTSSDINSRIALGSNNISSQLSKGTTYYIYAGAVDPSFGSAQTFNICISEDPNPNQILSNSQRGDAEFSAPIIYSTQSIKSGHITYSASDYLEVLRKFEIFNESTLTVNIGPYNIDRLKSQNVVRSK